MQQRSVYLLHISFDLVDRLMIQKKSKKTNRLQTKVAARQLNLSAYLFLLIFVCILTLALITSAASESAKYKEYEIKAAFMYNFLKFVDWPAHKDAVNDKEIIISILGKAPFGDTLKSIEGKSVDDKKVVIKKFKGIEELEKSGEKDNDKLHPEIEAIRKSHLLFICPSEKRHIREILGSVKNHNVLTVADTEGFLEAGGIINFLMEENKVHFEVNMTAAKNTGLEIRSKLLRLAKRVIKQEETG